MDDCIIIGAGPAGLTAAIYLARFHLGIRLLDCGSDPLHTHPCRLPERISGRALLARMLAQAERHGATREAAEVTGLRLIEGWRNGARSGASAAPATNPGH